MTTETRRQDSRYHWQVFLLAVGFLTRLPVPPDPDFSEQKLDKTSPYFPLVGLLIALLCAVVVLLANALFDHLLLAVLLSVAASLLITGAFHEDGLADSADGFGGGWQRDDVLRIMKDSRIGSYGTVAVVTALALKVTALSALGSAGEVAVALLWGHGLSRWVTISLLMDLDYVSGEGKSKPLARQLSSRESLCAMLPLAPLLLISPLPSLFFMLPALFVFRLGYAEYLRRRIGGYTGDALGAAQQVSEVLIYLAFLV